MKLVSFRTEGQIRLGIRMPSGVIDVARAAHELGVDAPVSAMEAIAAGPAGLERLQRVAEAVDPTALRDEAELVLAPAVPAPSKIVCVGTNYRRHAIESKLPIPDYPVYFSKFVNSLAGHGEAISLPAIASQYDYEVELVAVIGKRVLGVTPEDALKAVFGYATGNDLSARDLQFRTSQWLFGKALDGFAPLGPYLVTADEVRDPQRLQLRCWVNGELRQNSNTEDMIFSVAELISDLSQVMTLEPGDVIFTGTPEGVILGMEDKRWLVPGDEVVCEVEGLGRLVNQLI